MPNLSAAQRNRIHRLAAPPPASPDQAGAELNVVPFLDIIMNVLMFVLATLSLTFTTTITVAPPAVHTGGLRPTEPKRLSLSLFITADGVTLKTAGGSIATGCEGLGAGITVPATGLDASGQPVVDYTKVTACASRLKRESPDFRDETQVRLAASNNISYWQIVRAIDSVRRADNGEVLFPDVVFAVPR